MDKWEGAEKDNGFPVKVFRNMGENNVRVCLERGRGRMDEAKGVRLCGEVGCQEISLALSSTPTQQPPLDPYTIQ